MDKSKPPLDRSRLLALGWAAFLACSWTWCIGMFLPVLLVRDFGPAGWFVFMAPNIVGAAALGWVLHKPGAAAAIARRHWNAAAAFSVVTVFFHAFFIGWIVIALVGHWAEVITSAAAIGFYLFGRRGRGDLLAAAALFVVSLAAFITAASMPHIHASAPVGVRPVIGLLWLSPICVFGFLLCPYLDLTFLRARASTDSPSGIAAFTLGFGVLFLVMILFTFWYARLLQPGRLSAIPTTLAWIIAGHMMLQSAYTVALHTRALSEDRRAKKPEMIASYFLGITVVFLIGAWSEHLFPAPSGMTSGELVYRLFMAFYGLIFPAYVWICIIPTRAHISASPRQKLFALAVAVTIAGPMFWLGFINNHMVWLMPGITTIIVARYLARMLPSPGMGR